MQVGKQIRYLFRDVSITKEINSVTNIYGHKFKMGSIVYASYQPQNPGKVLRIFEGHADQKFHFAEIKFKKGIVTTDVNGISLLEKLIEDHEKKLNGHKKRLKQAEEL